MVGLVVDNLFSWTCCAGPPDPVVAIAFYSSSRQFERRSRCFDYSGEYRETCGRLKSAMPLFFPLFLKETADRCDNNFLGPSSVSQCCCLKEGVRLWREDNFDFLHPANVSRHQDTECPTPSGDSFLKDRGSSLLRSSYIFNSYNTDRTAEFWDFSTRRSERGWNSMPYLSLSAIVFELPVKSGKSARISEVRS